MLTPGGTPLYKLHRFLSPHRVGFLLRFGLKTSVHFAHFCLESGMIFERTTGVYKRIYRFKSKWVRKKERNMRIWNGFEEFFCLLSNPSNDNIISFKRQGLKRVWILEVWSENGCGKLHFLVWNRVRIWRTGCGTPHQEFPVVPPGY